MADTIIEEVRGRLKEAKQPIALTGAGISAESGVPTFRGADGLWRNYRAEELATPEAFRADPRLVWEFYQWRRELLSKVKPNRAHLALASLERDKDFTIITQNVDGLHSLAGSRNVLELHGSIWVVRCVDCGAEREDRTVPFPELPPRCGCGGLLRPGVVWFGEMLPEAVLHRTYELIKSTDLMLVIGTSGVVQPAASFASMAKTMGAFVVEINMEKTPVSSTMDVVINGRAGDILPQIVGKEEHKDEGIYGKHKAYYHQKDRRDKYYRTGGGYSC